MLKIKPQTKVMLLAGFIVIVIAAGAFVGMRQGGLAEVTGAVTHAETNYVDQGGNIWTRRADGTYTSPTVSGVTGTMGTGYVPTMNTPGGSAATLAVYSPTGTTGGNNPTTAQTWLLNHANEPGPAGDAATNLLIEMYNNNQLDPTVSTQIDASIIAPPPADVTAPDTGTEAPPQADAGTETATTRTEIEGTDLIGFEIDGTMYYYSEDDLQSGMGEMEETPLYTGFDAQTGQPTGDTSLSIDINGDTILYGDGTQSTFDSDTGDIGTRELWGSTQVGTLSGGAQDIYLTSDGKFTYGRDGPEVPAWYIDDIDFNEDLSDFVAPLASQTQNNLFTTAGSPGGPPIPTDPDYEYDMESSDNLGWWASQGHQPSLDMLTSLARTQPDALAALAEAAKTNDDALAALQGIDTDDARAAVEEVNAHRAAAEEPDLGEAGEELEEGADIGKEVEKEVAEEPEEEEVAEEPEAPTLDFNPNSPDLHNLGTDYIDADGDGEFEWVYQQLDPATGTVGYYTQNEDYTQGGYLGQGREATYKDWGAFFDNADAATIQKYIGDAENAGDDATDAQKAAANAADYEDRSRRMEEWAWMAAQVLHPGAGAQQWGEWIAGWMGFDSPGFFTREDPPEWAAFAMQGYETAICDYKRSKNFIQDYPGHYQGGIAPGLTDIHYITAERVEFGGEEFDIDWSGECKFDDLDEDGTLDGARWFPKDENEPLGYLYKISWYVSSPVTSARADEIIDEQGHGGCTDMGLDRDCNLTYKIIVKGKGCNMGQISERSDGNDWGTINNDWEEPIESISFKVPPGGVSSYTLSIYDIFLYETVCLDFGSYKYLHDDYQEYSKWPRYCDQAVVETTLDYATSFEWQPEGNTYSGSGSLGGGVSISGGQGDPTSPSGSGRWCPPICG